MALRAVSASREGLTVFQAELMLPCIRQQRHATALSQHDSLLWLMLCCHDRRGGLADGEVISVICQGNLR